MNVSTRRYLVMGISLSLFTIPFFYNACGNFSARKVKDDSLSSSCKVEKGVALKVNPTPDQTFAKQKVKLFAGSEENQQQKATSQVIAKDSELALIFNTSCALQTNSKLRNLLDQPVSDSISSQAIHWKTPRDISADELNELVNDDPCVEGVSWDREYEIQSFSDPYLTYQSNLSAIRAELSYAEFYNSNYGMKLSTGSDVIVAVLDTGIDPNHPDLAGKIWQNAGYGVDAKTLYSTSAVNYNPLDISTIGHGTHVAGLVAAASNNAAGIVGTMPYRAKVMAIRVFENSGSGLTTKSSYVYNGLRYAWENGASVVNMSLAASGRGTYSDAVTESGVNTAVANGVTVITVIGNASTSVPASQVDGTSFFSIPAQFSVRDGVIGVGSFDSQSGDKSSFSHYSTQFAEISAPGAEFGTTGVYSTIPTSLGSYGRLAGTSQSGPQVAAAAALTIGLIKSATGFAPTPYEVERLLLQSAIKSAKLSAYYKDGNRLDLMSLVQKIQTDYPATKGKTGGGTICP